MAIDVMDETEAARVAVALQEEREGLLARLHNALEKPMLVLAFVWLALFVVETLWGTSPLLTYVGYVIWALFFVEFALGFVLSPSKLGYLRNNWLKAIALVAPALRLVRIVAIARIARAASATRGLRMLRLLSSVNRSMTALSSTMGRHGFGYVVLLTFIVLLAGAAGMYYFENDSGPLSTYGSALWWTAMILTTMGSEYWPKTPEGRLLCFFLAVYSFTVFGYVTATLATYFVGRESASRESGAPSDCVVRALRTEISALRAEIRALGLARGSSK
jgi:voltage-gated potassium channel